MSYRFVKIASFYDAFLADYQARHADCAAWPYKAQHQALMDEGFAWSDHLSRALRRLGVEADEIVENAQVLQAAWLRDHGAATHDPLDILVQQLRHAGAEVVFLQDPLRFPAGWITHLRDRVPSIRVVTGWLCAPYGPQAIAILREMDFVMTGTPGFIEDFRAQGLRAFLTYHAFDPSNLDRLAKAPPGPQSDLVFIGSLIAGSSFHDERGRLLDHLVKQQVDVKIFGQVAEPPLVKTLVKRGLLQAARWGVGLGLPATGPVARILRWQGTLSLARFTARVKARVHPAVYGLDMLRALQGARVAFNGHIGVAGRYGGNLRLFEATGVGACLLTDWKSNLGDLFEDGREIVAYRSPEECVEKARWLIDHPKECAAIAQAGQARTLRDHNFDRMGGEIDAAIRHFLHR